MRPNFLVVRPKPLLTEYGILLWCESCVYGWCYCSNLSYTPLQSYRVHMWFLFQCWKSFFFGKPPNYVFTRTPLIQPCLSVKWMMLIQKLVLLEKFLQAENERQMVEISRSATILPSDDSEWKQNNCTVPCWITVTFNSMSQELGHPHWFTLYAMQSRIHK